MNNRSTYVIKKDGVHARIERVNTNDETQKDTIAAKSIIKIIIPDHSDIGILYIIKPKFIKAYNIGNEHTINVTTKNILGRGGPCETYSNVLKFNVT